MFEATNIECLPISTCNPVTVSGYNSDDEEFRQPLLDMMGGAQLWTDGVDTDPTSGIKPRKTDARGRGRIGLHGAIHSPMPFNPRYSNTYPCPTSTSEPNNNYNSNEDDGLEQPLFDTTGGHRMNVVGPSDPVRGPYITEAPASVRMGVPFSQFNVANFMNNESTERPF
jgi:hypothetical protein